MDLAERIRAARKVMLIGNGGSFANAMHIANDLLSCGIPAYTMDPATFSAFANDNGYYQAFRLWLKVVGEPGDLLIALSGSGKSPNILLACDEARLIGMDVYTLFGAELGQDMQTAETYQLVIGHELLKALRK